MSFAGFRINLSEQLLENEAAQTGCGIQSSHSESGDGQSNEAFSYAEGEAELGHEGTNAISKYVYRTTVFQQFGQLVAANIAYSNNCNYSQNAFKQHGAVADELSIAFAIELFGGSTGGYQGVEATDSTAGNGYEQHREHRVGAFAGRIKGGECRQLHGRLINCDTNQSECDAGIQQEGVQIVTRLQQNPDRSDGSNEDVNHQDANPYVFGQVQRIHVAESNCNNQHDNTDNGAYAEAQAAAIYGEAEDNSQDDEQQAVAACGLATKVAATMLAKAAITTSRVTYAKMEKRNLPLLPRVASIIWPMVLPSKRMEEYRAPKSCTPPKKMLPIKIHSNRIQQR